MKIHQTALHELDKVRSFYERCQYQGGALPDDVILCAEGQGNIVGIVRLAIEHNVIMLRGMQVDPAHHRRGIGRKLLLQFQMLLDPYEPCFCVPFRHLIKFYGIIGFKEIQVNEAPPHLAARLARYRNDGLDMIIMKIDAINTIPV